jgi:MFS family permease
MPGFGGDCENLVRLAFRLIGSHDLLSLALPSAIRLNFQGFSDLEASILMAIFSLACAFGCLLGGFLGDMAARWSPDHGRIMVAQVR